MKVREEKRVGAGASGSVLLVKVTEVAADATLAPGQNVVHDETPEHDWRPVGELGYDPRPEWAR